LVFGSVLKNSIIEMFELTKGFIENLKQIIVTKEKRWCVAITVIIIAIIVTPLCGFLFQCGCDWPWLGLDSNCNFYQPDVVPQCPWCASMITGIFSTVLTGFMGIYVSTISISLTNLNVIKEMAIRTLSGVFVYVLLVTPIASLAAFFQNYSLGIGSYFH
jgi:hypothetical protein